MNGLSAKLDQLESRLQTLIEGRLARLLPTRAIQDELVQRLVAAMKSGARIMPDGTALAPDVYVLMAHPDLAFRMSASNKLLDDLKAIIQDVGSKSGFSFAKPAEVHLSLNPDLGTKSVEVMARISLDGLGETVELGILPNEPSPNIPLNAFLIVNGAQIYPLERTVINIGRRSDNDLVIDDPRVSRFHAQLRAIRGKYVISDLGSTDGTRVNGQRVTQQILHPRDVISLAGVPLVYSQDENGPGQTQEISTAELSHEQQEGSSEAATGMAT
jgi:hypothetical protein